MSEKDIIKIYNEGIDAIVGLVKGLSSQIAQLTIQVNVLYVRVTELEAQLNKNSNNSSKPPSSDGLKKKPKNNRKKSGKPIGGQPGHEGKTLEKVKNPDEVVDIKPEHCECGCNLEGVKGTIRTRQVFEIPIIKIKVTEYKAHEIECPGCGKLHKRQFPEGINQPVQYGENLQALMAYLTNYQLIPLERAAELIRDLTDQDISQGTFVNTNKRIEKNFEGFEKAVIEQLIGSDIAHFDETGMHSDKKTKWVHSASTDKLIYYVIHDKRGEDATKAIRILPEFQGTAVHDHWRSYYTYIDCTHAECNAHYLRNLKGIYENYGHEWAKGMSGLLVEFKKRVESLKEQGVDSMPSDDIKAYMKRYDYIIAKGKEGNTAKTSGLVSEKTGKLKKGEALNLFWKSSRSIILRLSLLCSISTFFSIIILPKEI